MTVDRSHVTFPNGRGEKLAARLELPEGEPRAWALFAHCFTCSKDIVAAGRISRGLSARGIAVLRFDFTGIGNSDGDLANESFSSNVDDLLAAADHLRQTYAAPSLLIGHSLGGAAVVIAAPRIEGVKAVVTINAPADPEHLTRLLGDDLADIEENGQAEVELAGRRFTISKSFVDDLRAHSVERALGDYDGALLILHAPRDEIVSVDHAAVLFAAAGHPKSFVSLDTADHLLTRKDDAAYVAETLAAWASRYVIEKRPDEGTVTVWEEGEPYAQRVHLGEHVIIADEPAKAGGGDRGPTPYDLLLSALGTCTSMTIRMYADRKGWPLHHVSVHLSHEKIHATDCKECDKEDGKVDRMTREIRLQGPLDGDQRARLLEIADRCPVHRTLEGEKEIVTRLVGPGAE
jgi:putative redox protein